VGWDLPFTRPCGWLFNEKSQRRRFWSLPGLLRRYRFGNQRIIITEDRQFQRQFCRMGFDHGDKYIKVQESIASLLDQPQNVG
jgi:hypothetical protein